MKTYEHLTLNLESDRLILNNMRKDIQEKLKGMPELLSIGQVAEIFSIHQDTLRNWEKDGTLVPLRIGPRKDRKYRPQDIQAIVDKMGSKLTLPQLEAFLWKSADILRGKIDSSDYKKYIFGLLFYKRMSDVWDEEYDAVIKEYNDKTIAGADYNHRFQVPKDCRWNVVTEQAESIGQKLNDIFEKLANANSPKLDKIFDDLDFANKDRFPNETLQRLINHFSQYNFGNTYISSDLLGDAYEYLIKQFAADAGKKGGEFYTPREVEKVIIGILKPHQKDHIYDPTAGSGGFLLEAYDYLKQKSGEKIAKTLYLYGQELNISTFAIAKINMFLHGLDSADIRRGDTIANPQFLTQNGNLQTFDICVANPPYSIKDWESEIFKTNKYGRLEGYDMPPEKNADYAFVLHIIKSMNVNGRAGIVLPHGVLFRGGAEGRIREQILKNDLVEAVIALPSKLFYGTGIPAAILILNKNKPENKKNKVLIIDAEKDFLEGKNQNSLRPQDINKIVKAYDAYSDIEKYARVIDIKEIAEKEYSLDVQKYIDSSEEKIEININLVQEEIKKLIDQFNKADEKVSLYLKKLDTAKNLPKNKLPIGWSKVKLEDVLDYEQPTEYIVASNILKEKIVESIPVLTANKSFILGYTKEQEGVFSNVPVIIFDDFTTDKKYVDFNFKVKSSALKILKLKNPKIADLKYIFEMMGLIEFNPKTHKRYWISEYSKINIILPTISEQKEITKILCSVDNQITINKEIQKKLSKLKKGLVSDLLSGKREIR
ncbi:MAG: type I restriction-modification system subunit M [Candidatus Portnoybacteria bacterium]|nr:type I restriction-modification system subunit M [Candidatus Portnoybacteria bacterium]